jgi:hypothetical protein
MSFHARRLISRMVGLLLMKSGYLFRLARSPEAGVTFSMTSNHGRRHDKMRARHDRQHLKSGV